MSVPVVAPGRSIAHRIVSRVAVSPPGRRFVGDFGARIDPTLLRLTRGRVSSVWPFPAVVMTHVGAKSGRTRTSALVFFTDRGRISSSPRTSVNTELQLGTTTLKRIRT